MFLLDVGTVYAQWGAKTFTGTADKVMADIFNAYTQQRGIERADGLKILDKVDAKAASLNVHEGTNGVNAETSKKLPAGSNAQKMQDGKLPIKYQGKTLHN